MTKPQPRQLPENVIGATAIRIERGEVAVDERAEEDRNGRVIGSRVGHVTGLRRYRAHRDISLRQFEAGIRLQNDLATAMSTVARVANLDSVGGSSDQHTAMLRAIVERRTAEVRMRKALGSLSIVCRSVITWVVLSDKPAGDWVTLGYSRREGLTVLKVALDALGDHYRLDKDGRTPSEQKLAKVRS